MIGTALNKSQMTSVRQPAPLSSPFSTRKGKKKAVLSNLLTFVSSLLLYIDRKTHGYDGPAMELPTWPANDAASRQFGFIDEEW